MPNIKNATVVKPFLQTTKKTLDQFASGNEAITNKGASEVILKVESLIVSNDSSIDVLVEITFDQTANTSTREWVFRTVVQPSGNKVLVSADAPLYIVGAKNLYISAAAWSGTAPNYTTEYIATVVSGVEIHA